MFTLSKLRKMRIAAGNKLTAALKQWEEDPSSVALAEKLMKARQEWDKIHEDYERARRRFEWTRARRIIALASAGRGQKSAQQFKKNGYRHVDKL